MLKNGNNLAKKMEVSVLNTPSKNVLSIAAGSLKY